LSGRHLRDLLMPHQGLKILLLAAPTGIVPANAPIVTTSIMEGFSKHTIIGVFLFSESF